MTSKKLYVFKISLKTKIALKLRQSIKRRLRNHFTKTRFDWVISHRIIKRSLFR